MGVTERRKKQNKTKHASKGIVQLHKKIPAWINQSSLRLTELRDSPVLDIQPCERYQQASRIATVFEPVMIITC